MKISSMLKQLSKKKKIILLRSSWRKGFSAFMKQIYLSIADATVRRRYLVFHINTHETSIVLDQVEEQAELLRFKNWHELSAPLRNRLNDGLENLEWGNIRFFERGRELWTLRIKDEIAVLGWLGFAELESDYIWPVPNGAEILHQLTVFPEFRGSGLQVTHRKMLMAERSKNSRKDFYISCHDYNSTSHRNILRMGFRPIGYSQKSRITGRLTFHPKAD